MNPTSPSSAGLERLLQLGQTLALISLINTVVNDSPSDQRTSQAFNGVTSNPPAPSGLSLNETPISFIPLILRALRDSGNEGEEGPSRYTESVHAHNTEQLNKARDDNKDGVAFLKAMFTEDAKSLNLKEMGEYQEYLHSADPALFIEIPHRIVSKFVSSSVPLKEIKLPHFLERHLDSLETLRQQRIYPMTGQALSNHHQIRNGIATSLSKSRDFIAALEGATQGWSAFSKGISL